MNLYICLFLDDGEEIFNSNSDSDSDDNEVSYISIYIYLFIYLKGGPEKFMMWSRGKVWEKF